MIDNETTFAATADEEEYEEERPAKRKRAGRTKKQAVDLLAIQMEGYHAYAAGQAKDTNPHPLDPEPCYSGATPRKSWDWGWQFGHTRTNNGADVPIYSLYPLEIAGEPALCKAQFRRNVCSQREPENYHMLPWSMADLIGSVWLNVHTQSEITIRSLGFDRFTARPDPTGRTPHQPTTPDYNRFDVHGLSHDIGLWSGGHFYIEHWVRVDTLAPEAQLRWYGQHIAELQHKLGNPAQRFGFDPAAATADLATARDTVRRFAEHHGIAVPLDVLNGTQDAPSSTAAATPDTKPTQLLLF